MVKQVYMYKSLIRMIKESSFLSSGSTFIVFPKFFDFLIF